MGAEAHRVIVISVGYRLKTEDGLDWRLGGRKVETDEE